MFLKCTVPQYKANYDLTTDKIPIHKPSKLGRQKNSRTLVIPGNNWVATKYTPVYRKHCQEYTKR